MTQIVSPANELLAPMIDPLRDGRTNFFDPIATNDLNNVRLFCRRVSFSWHCVEVIMSYCRCEDVGNRNSDIVSEHGL